MMRPGTAGPRSAGCSGNAHWTNCTCSSSARARPRPAAARRARRQGAAEARRLGGLGDRRAQPHPRQGMTPGSSRLRPVMGPLADRTSPTTVRTSAARSPRTTRAVRLLALPLAEASVKIRAGRPRTTATGPDAALGLRWPPVSSIRYRADRVGSQPEMRTYRRGCALC